MTRFVKYNLILSRKYFIEIANSNIVNLPDFRHLVNISSQSLVYVLSCTDFDFELCYCAIFNFSLRASNDRK